MATIGRGSAVARLGFLRLAGFPAWLAWLFVHLMLLVGFRNRVFVFFEWLWAYLTTQPRARLILQVGQSDVNPKTSAVSAHNVPSVSSSSMLR